MILFVFHTTQSCSTAGSYHSPVEPAPSSSAETSYLTVSGYLGVGSIYNADITVLDVSDFDKAAVVATTTSDSNGYFSFEIAEEEGDTFLFVASGGTYIDPISFKTVSGIGYELKAIYGYSNIKDDKSIYVTPFSSLLVSLTECLYLNSSLSVDPYQYALAIFEDVFQTDLKTAEDLNLNTSADGSTNNVFYTAYNLAFSNMAKQQNALSALDLQAVFSEALVSECSLITESPTISNKYSFYSESFREDYLNALQGLENNSLFEEIIGSTNLESLVQDIREKNHFIFSFEVYNES